MKAPKKASVLLADEQTLFLEGLTPFARKRNAIGLSGYAATADPPFG